MSNNYAYITLLSNNSYMPGIIATLESFKRTNSKYPFYVIILPEISDENKKILRYYGALLIEEKQIRPKNATHEFAYMDSHSIGSFHTCMAKLHIFKYTQFDKLIYVDADMIFCKNIDELFVKPHMSAVMDQGYIDTIKQFNAGLLVIKPDVNEFNNLIELLNSIDMNKANGVDDQQLLHFLNKDWPNRVDLHLPIKYNYVPYIHNTFNQYTLFNLFDVSILHMTGAEKPWRVNNLDYYRAMRGNLFLCYMQHYSEIINFCISDLKKHNLESVDLHLINWNFMM